jgi:hypothetical protein
MTREPFLNCDQSNRLMHGGDDRMLFPTRKVELVESPFWESSNSRLIKAECFSPPCSVALEILNSI